MSDDKDVNWKWVHCPQCRGKTRTKVLKKTVLINFPLFCPKCKTEFLVNVIDFKMVFSNEPDA